MTECMVVMYMYVMVKHFASIIVPDDAKEQISVIDNEITKSQGFDFYSYLIYVLFITISFFSTTSTVTPPPPQTPPPESPLPAVYGVLSSAVTIFSIIHTIMHTCVWNRPPPGRTFVSLP